MNNSQIFNATVCIIGIFIFLIHIANIMVKKEKRKDELCLLNFFVFTAIHFSIYLTFTIIRMSYTSNEFIIAFYTSFYIMNNIELLLFFAYMKSLTTLPKKSYMIINIVNISTFIIITILDILNIFIPMFFTANNGVYVRSSTMFLSQSYQFIMFTVSFFLAIFYKGFIIREKIAFSLYCILPAVAIIFQNIYEGYAIAYVSIIISTEILFVVLNAEKNIELSKEKEKAKDAQIRIMLSQIQPHFVYNSLSAMVTLFELVKRNIKLYFKDKGLFFSSLITPLILLVLYATFLAKVYKDSFISNIPDGVVIEEGIINSVVAGQLISSLLAVSCVTIAFCSNMIMITDKANERIYDLTITPAKRSILPLAYFISSTIATLIITMSTLGVSLIYLATQGFYMSGLDVFKTILDVILLTLFGTSLSCVINHFCKTNGAASAVGTLVSSIYGFICGAYMPLSQFGKGLQHTLSFLPGTYGTSLIKSHMLEGSFKELERIGASQSLIDGISESVDSRYYFFDNLVGEGTKYCVMILSVVIFTSIFVILNVIQNKKNK